MGHEGALGLSEIPRWPHDHAEVCEAERSSGGLSRTRIRQRDLRIRSASDVRTHLSHHNQGKRTVILNLKLDADLATARALAGHADVVIENFRPGVMKHVGSDYASLQSLGPKVTCLSVTGFGDDGPNVQLPAFDQVIQAMSGFIWTKGEGGMLLPIRKPVVDKATSLTACDAVVVALLHCERIRHGRDISVSLLDAFSAFVHGRRDRQRGGPGFGLAVAAASDRR